MWLSSLSLHLLYCIVMWSLISFTVSVTIIAPLVLLPTTGSSLISLWSHFSFWSELPGLSIQFQPKSIVTQWSSVESWTWDFTAKRRGQGLWEDPGKNCKIWCEFNYSFCHRCPCTFEVGFCGEEQMERQSANHQNNKEAICPHSGIHLWPEFNLGGAGRDEDQKPLETTDIAKSNGFKPHMLSGQD